MKCISDAIVAQKPLHVRETSEPVRQGAMPNVSHLNLMQKIESYSRNNTFVWFILQLYENNTGERANQMVYIIWKCDPAVPGLSNAFVPFYFMSFVYICNDIFASIQSDLRHIMLDQIVISV
jgi:hypothetical protein